MATSSDDYDSLEESDVRPGSGRLIRQAADPLQGAWLDETYELVELIGVGGMGRVYRAVQHPLGRTVAIKVMAPKGRRGAETAARFRREAMAAAALQHPHTIRIFDFGELDDGRLYMVMEYLEGGTLADVLEEGFVDLRWLAGVLEQVVAALSEAHSRSILHRDLKPSNIFLARVPGGLIAKVFDFGLAKAFERNVSELADITSEGVVVGTAGYLAPEQIRGEPLDQRTDVWALGILLYRAAAGRPPFVGSEALVVHRTLERDPEPPSAHRPGLPREVDRVIMSAIEKDPDRRPQSVVELGRGFARAVGIPFQLDDRGGVSTAAAGTDSSWVIPLVGAVLAIAAAAGVVIWLAWQ